MSIEAGALRFGGAGQATWQGVPSKGTSQCI